MPAALASRLPSLFPDGSNANPGAAGQGHRAPLPHPCHEARIAPLPAATDQRSAQVSARDALLDLIEAAALRSTGGFSGARPGFDCLHGRVC